MVCGRWSVGLTAASPLARVGHGRRAARGPAHRRSRDGAGPRRRRPRRRQPRRRAASRRAAGPHRRRLRRHAAGRMNAWAPTDRHVGVSGSRTAPVSGSPWGLGCACLPLGRRARRLHRRGRSSDEHAGDRLGERRRGRCSTTASAGRRRRSPSRSSPASGRGASPSWPGLSHTIRRVQLALLRKNVSSVGLTRRTSH